VRFSAPGYLVLLAAPAALLLLWVWQLWRRQRDLARMRRHRRTPVRERLSQLGDLAFWLCLLLALTSVILALSRPIAVISIVQSAGIDLVILQDGSASMRVRDVTGDRWKRSMAFLRTLGESLRWDDDRVALALFASIATPQVRLTRDPNTFFFFLDHLEGESPFRLQDDTTWDTNIERGIYWGLRLIEKDEELAKQSGQAEEAASRHNARAFVLISDGQAWSGEVATSIALAQKRGVPLFVVGVGTTAGGIIPEPNRDPNSLVLSATLDRSSLGAIATAGGGRYSELGRDDDRDIANAIIESTRRRAASGGVQENTEDLYWQLLAAAAVLVGLGVLFLRDQAALALQLVAAAGVLAMLIVVAK
jgi:Ca-activated chloride channel family protein